MRASLCCLAPVREAAQIVNSFLERTWMIQYQQRYSVNQIGKYCVPSIPRTPDPIHPLSIHIHVSLQQDRHGRGWIPGCIPHPKGKCLMKWSISRLTNLCSRVAVLVHSSVHFDADTNSNSDSGTNNEKGNTDLDQDSLTGSEARKPHTSSLSRFCHALFLSLPEFESTLCGSLLSVSLLLRD